MSKLEDNTLFDMPLLTDSQSDEDVLKEIDNAIDLFPDEDEPTEEVIEDTEEEDEGESEVEEKPETPKSDEEDDFDEEKIFDSLREAVIQKGFIEVEDKDTLKTQEDIVNAYQDKIDKSARQNILEDLNQKLISRGVNDYHLEIAMRLANGIDESSISELNYYKSKSETQFDKLSTDQAVEYCKEFLDKSNVPTAAKKRILESLEVDDEFLQTTFEDALQFNKNSYKELDDDQKEAAQVILENKETSDRQNKETLQRILSSGEVMGEKITNPALFNKMVTEYNTTVNIGGKEYPTTEWGKFLLDFQNDISLRLLAFKQYKFKKEEIEKVAEESAEKGKIDLLKNFKKEKVTLSKKQQEPKNNSGVKTYLFNSGGITQKN